MIRGLQPIKLLDDIEEKYEIVGSFHSFGKKISGVLVGSNPKQTIGIYGDWGTGKSTLMRTVQKNFVQTSGGRREQQEWVYTVWFNAFKYERETENIAISLILTILEKLSEIVSNSNDSEQKKWYKGKKYRLRKFVKSWSARLYNPIGFLNVDMSFYGQANIDDTDYSKLTKPNMQEGLELVKMFLERVPVEIPNGLKLIVFLDDIDRCSPKKALELFESTQVLLEVNGITIILGLNPAVIHRYIDLTFKESQTQADEVISKIIHVPIRIPPWDSYDFTELIRKNILPKLDDKYYKILKEKEDLLFNGVNGNPRKLKKLINSIIMSVEIYGEYTNAEHLLLIELMHSIWPDFYSQFVVRQSFRDKIFEFVDMTTHQRLQNIGEMRKKVSKTIDDEVIPSINSDLWNFLRNYKYELSHISDWKYYRSASKISESIDESDKNN